MLKVVVNAIHAAALGLHTVIDMLARDIKNAIDLGKEAGKLARLFIVKAMRILGMRAKEIGKDMTKSFFVYILREFVSRAHKMAQKAMREML